MDTEKHRSGPSIHHSAFSLLHFSASLRLCGAILFLALGSIAQTKDFTRYVNPFIGTGGHGHTFPGATLPFGMVQLSPDTRIDNWDGSSGYHYSDDIIYGFSHTHLSGTGIPDGCDILFMPAALSPVVELHKSGEAPGYPTKFKHENERAEPGYYSVKLDGSNVLAELTSTNRVGFHRYTFPDAKRAVVFLDLFWRDKMVDGSINRVNSTTIEGFRRSSSWAKDETVYFAAQFSRPISNSYLSSVKPEVKKSLRAQFDFGPIKNEQILLKVAISYVSMEGARKNLEAELPGWDFDKVRADAKAAWNKELSRIEVSGGTPDQTTNFYTALYHTMIQPNVFNDVDGGYKGHDGKIHSLRDDRQETGDGRQTARNTKPETRNSEHYTVFSLWDTFRAAHPLYTIIDQKRTADFINTFIRISEQGGSLPVWELWGEETDTMIGYHAVSVIADAMAKGIKGFDYEKAYAAAKHSAELDHFDLAAYKKRGYISMEDENESVSKTLEYAYDDWCIAQMAKMIAARYEKFLTTVNKVYYPDLGSEYGRDYQKYSARARNFENLFDPATGFMRPKKNGGFVEPFGPNEVTFGFTEGNSWQYSFFVPQDVTRLIQLYGGNPRFAEKLDELFNTDQKLAGREQADLTGLIGQYAHGNEPSHHIAYLYSYAGEPWTTQKLVRKIMSEFYKPTPDGLIGNEDCGQMSAWYVLSASGFYPVAPGSPVYTFGTPLFKEVKYHLENGKTFTIKSPNVSAANFYIRAAQLNGQPYRKAFISHENLMLGGALEFEMADHPFPMAFTEFPVSSIDANSVAVPVINGERMFKGETTVTMSTVAPGARISYTIDNHGEESARKTFTYTGPFKISGTSTVEAFAIDPKTKAESFKTSAIFRERPNDWTVKVISGYSTQYTGGGDNAIVDGIRGTTNFASGEWQGIQGKPYEAVIDLQRVTDIKEVGGSFLQVASPWIWMPVNIKFEISNNGTDWAEVADIKTDVPQTEMNPTIKEFRRWITPTKGRYVRVRAFNIGKIPSWHPGAGGDPWIFVDEIFIR